MEDILCRQKIFIKPNKLMFTYKGREFVRQHILNPNDINEQLSNIKFNDMYKAVGGRLNRNEALENAKLPPIAYAYYYLYVTALKIPQPYELVDMYIKLFCNCLGNNTYNIKQNIGEYSNIVFSKNEITARIMRAYNSFNRELSCLAVIGDTYTNNVYYDFYTDFYKGIDIVYENKAAIAIYQSTKNAYKFRTLKEKYRHSYNVGLYPLIADIGNNTITCGDIEVFDNATIANLILKIETPYCLS